MRPLMSLPHFTLTKKPLNAKAGGKYFALSKVTSTDFLTQCGGSVLGSIKSKGKPSELSFYHLVSSMAGDQYYFILTLKYSF